MADEPAPKEPDKPDPEARYFELGAKFLADCYVLLGHHVTESHQTIGELDPEVKKALNLLALSTIWRMTRIMENDQGIMI
jgi:hypothetical protein